MQRPDWKVAVIGGSIAALGLGGFAAAQQGSTSNDAPDSIRLQRDASVSLHSLSSVVTATTRVDDTNSVSVASLNTVNSVSNQSLDSVPSVAPTPQPAPTSVAPAPAPASADSFDSSVSVASVASVDSVDSSN